MQVSSDFAASKIIKYFILLLNFRYLKIDKTHFPYRISLYIAFASLRAYKKNYWVECQASGRFPASRIINLFYLSVIRPLWKLFFIGTERAKYRLSTWSCLFDWTSISRDLLYAVHSAPFLFKFAANCQPIKVSSWHRSFL